MTLHEIDQQIEHLMRQRDVITRTTIQTLCNGCNHASNKVRITQDSVCCDVRNVNYARRCWQVSACKRVTK